MPILTVERLYASREGAKALEDVSFSLEQGDCLCVLGENGAGKSTLIRCLAGVVAPDAGTVRFGAGLRPTAIGYLPQQSEYRPDFPAAVSEIVRSGLIARKRAFIWYSRADRARVAQAMERLGVADLANQRYCDLSGGQRQRVLLARTLVSSERLMLLDEPATGLDAAHTTELYDVVSEIHHGGVTVVLSANDARTALMHATKILHLHRKALFWGTAQEYLRSDIGQETLAQTDHT